MNELNLLCFDQMSTRRRSFGIGTDQPIALLPIYGYARTSTHLLLESRHVNGQASMFTVHIHQRMTHGPQRNRFEDKSLLHMSMRVKLHPFPMFFFLLVPSEFVVAPLYSILLIQGPTSS